MIILDFKVDEDELEACLEESERKIETVDAFCLFQQFF
jgi:hypothetical protein